MAVNKIEKGVVVTIAYRLTSEGVEIEETDAEDPLEYLHGAGNIVPGLETALDGRKAGDKFSITLQPEDAYGEYDDEDVEIVAREDVPEGLEVGMEVLLEDEDGELMEAYVTAINDDSVVLDFNDPLAGKVVTYEVEVLELREADEEEVAQGYPHGAEDFFDAEDYDDYEDDEEEDEE
jgi:FKBP-type peptidyl-prolyl cis-trans isomerase SlyD